MSMNGHPSSTLRQLTTLISSGSTPLGGQSVYLEDGPVMLVRSQNVRMNRLDVSDVAYISNEIDSQMQRSVVKHNDVLLNITGASIGRVTRFNLKDTRANVNQHVCIIRPKPDRLSSRYLEYFLSSPQVQNDINNRHQHGGTRQALTFAQISEFEIPLPPLSEQKRIADILDKADAIRRKRQSLLVNASCLPSSIFQDLFIENGSCPKGRLGDYTTKITSGSTPRGGRNVYLDEGPVMLVRSQNVQMNRLDLSDVAYISEDLDKQMERSVLQQGDVLLNITGASIGRVARFTLADTRANVNQHVCIIRCDSTRLSPVYVEQFLSTGTVQNDIHNRYQHGGTRQALTFAQIADFEIPLPPIELQAEYMRAVDKHGIALSSLIDAKNEADSLFNSLIQRAFKGEL